MTIYLVGCVVALILALFVHIIEYKEGCIKDVTSDIIITIFVVLLSWAGVVFCLAACIHYFKGGD